MRPALISIGLLLFCYPVEAQTRQTCFGGGSLVIGRGNWVAPRPYVRRVPYRIPAEGDAVTTRDVLAKVVNTLSDIDERMRDAETQIVGIDDRLAAVERQVSALSNLASQPRPAAPPVVVVPGGGQGAGGGITPNPDRIPPIRDIRPNPDRIPPIRDITPDPNRVPPIRDITPDPNRVPPIQDVTPDPNRIPPVRDTSGPVTRQPRPAVPARTYQEPWPTELRATVWRPHTTRNRR